MIEIANSQYSAITTLLSQIEKSMETNSNVFKANIVRRGDLLLKYLSKVATPAMAAFLREVQDMQGFIEDETFEEVGDMVERLKSLNIIMARSGRMLASARALRAQAERCVLDTMDHETIAKMPAANLKKMLQAETAELGEVEDALDRINRACVHQSENLRTMISFAKEELRLTRTGY